MTRAVAFTQAKIPSVYFVRIGKHVKIGFSRNVTKRMKSFETSSADVELLFAFEATQAMERHLHTLFDDARIRGELFRPDWRISQFIDYAGRHGLAKALEFLEETTPQRLEKRREEDRAARVAERRLNRAEKDAYFASLVSERKARLGW